MNKVCSVATSNDANMALAVIFMKLRHLPCFAQTLDMVVRNSFTNTEEVQILQENVKCIVTYFHYCVKALGRLSQFQEQQGLPIKKLTQAVETRWNSTFYMMQRFGQLAEPIISSLCLMGKNNMPK